VDAFVYEVMFLPQFLGWFLLVCLSISVIAHRSCCSQRSIFMYFLQCRNCWLHCSRDL